MRRSVFFLLGTVTVTWACTLTRAPRPEAVVRDAFEPTAQDRAEILGALQALFDAIETGDETLLSEAVVPDVLMRSMRPGPDGDPIFGETSVDQLADMISRAPGTMMERMWQAEVRLSGGLASVWAPYDFYRENTFSHCGVDAAHLMRMDEGWRIVSLTWSALQPPDCDPHPDGPPGA